MKRAQVDKLNAELKEVLHPPYVQLETKKIGKPKYMVFDHYGRCIASGQTLGDVRMFINYFLSIDV